MIHIIRNQAAHFAGDRSYGYAITSPYMCQHCAVHLLEQDAKWLLSIPPRRYRNQNLDDKAPETVKTSDYCREGCLQQHHFHRVI